MNCSKCVLSEVAGEWIILLSQLVLSVCELAVVLQWALVLIKVVPAHLGSVLLPEDSQVLVVLVVGRVHLLLVVLLHYFRGRVVEVSLVVSFLGGVLILLGVVLVGGLARLGGLLLGVVLVFGRLDIVDLDWGGGVDLGLDFGNFSGLGFVL